MTDGASKPRATCPVCGRLIEVYEGRLVPHRSKRRSPICWGTFRKVDRV
jgi:hypothetical protein